MTAAIAAESRRPLTFDGWRRFVSGCAASLDSLILATATCVRFLLGGPPGELRQQLESDVRRRGPGVARERDGVLTEEKAGASRRYALGRYRIVAELARGGMGVVYLALVRGPGAFSKLQVIKELKPELLEDPAIVEMFMEEARLAACLSHPNIVQTVEAGTEANRHYIVMEYLDGQSFYRVVSRARKVGRPIPFEFQATVLCNALEGLAYAHSARNYDGSPLGIVHRDVSPQNFFIGYDGQVKVLDFGIAKAVSSSAETRTGILKGKIAYMAPEQAAGATVDGRADLFSIGVMLCEAATGRRFWAGKGNDMQILHALLRGDLDLGQQATAADIPDDLRAVIGKAVAANPSGRYASAALMLGELRAALAKRGTVPWSAEGVGRLVHELFAQDRARLQEAIDTALRAHSGPTSGQYPVSQVRSLTPSDLPSTSLPVATQMTQTSVPILWQTSVTGSSSLSDSDGATPARGNSTARRRGARWWSVGASGFAICALAVLALVAVRRRIGLPQAVVSVAPPVAPNSVNATREPQRPLSDKVHMIVRANPPQARIVVDKSQSFDNPCVILLPKDGTTHALHVEAEGYVSRDDVFDANTDGTLLITLEPRFEQRRTQPRAIPSPRVVSAPAPISPPTAEPAPTVVQQATAPLTIPAGALPQRRISAINPYNH
jgi:eukaryotic-like serine/threonine-protein kinase